MKPQLLEEWLAQQLDRRLDLSLQQQLYRGLRDAILQQRLPPAARLPSSRALADNLQLARNTVMAALEQLQAEGFVESRRGAGYFVAPVLPDRPPAGRTSRQGTDGNNVIALSQRCQNWLHVRRSSSRASAGAFLPAMPDLRSFPFTDWWRLLHKHQRAAPWQWFDYGDGGGLPALRQAIANHLGVARAVRCTPEQVIVTGSTQQSLDLCCRILADAGDTMVIEEPGYLGARASAIAAGLKLQPVPVDEHGLQTDDLPRKAPRLIYVTPSHQYPMGSVMSLSRRQALLAYAAKQDSYVIEDDYDSEIRFNTRPLASLQGLDRHQRVLYLGTFSKVMYPALQLAYVVVPKNLAEPFAHSHARLQGTGGTATQAALAEFIASGRLASHIRRMRKHYSERNDYLRQRLSGHLGQRWQLLGGDAGLHVVLQSARTIDDIALSQTARERHITLLPLSPHYLGDNRRTGFLLGYAAADTRELARGYRVLRELMG